jgi:hypothetical protein
MNEIERKEDEFEGKTKKQPHLESLTTKTNVGEDEKGGIDG